jgi:hypothetical protein
MTWLYIATNAQLELLAHVASHNMKAVSDTFRRHKVSPHPQHKPNMNENRGHNSMLGPLRSPPPAAKWNRSSSTAQCTVCSYYCDNLPDGFFAVSCIDGMYECAERAASF